MKERARGIFASARRTGRVRGFRRRPKTAVFRTDRFS
jgi:hypothetical protein